MAYSVGDVVQSLDRVTGQWHTAVLENVSTNKGRIQFSDIRRDDEWKSLGNLSAETRQLLSVDSSLRSLCQRAEDERGDCIPGRRRILRGQTTVQHELSVYLLENIDDGGDVSCVVCQRLKDIGIQLHGEIFLKLMEIVIGEIDDCFTKKDLIRPSIPVRMMKRSLGPGRLPPPTSPQLCRDDDVWFGDSGDIKAGQVDTNDPFKCCVTTTDGIVIPYENLQKQPEDSFVLQLSITTASDDDTAADPDWASSRTCVEDEDELEDEYATSHKRKRSQKITSTPMVKRRKESTRRRITILGSGQPYGRSTEPDSCIPVMTAEASPSLSPSVSPPSSSCHDESVHQDMAVEVALLRADVNTTLDNQRRIMVMLTSLTRGSAPAPTPTRGDTSSDTLTDPTVWDLRLVDIPEVLTNTTVRQAMETRNAGDPVHQAKEACGGTRESLAKELFLRFFTLGDTYGRNVYGRTMGRQQQRKPMKKELIDNILTTCFQVFPTHSQAKHATSACVNAINTFNRYMRNRRLSTTKFPKLPTRYDY